MNHVWNCSRQVTISVPSISYAVLSWWRIIPYFCLSTLQIIERAKTFLTMRSCVTFLKVNFVLCADSFPSFESDFYFTTLLLKMRLASRVNATFKLKTPFSISSFPFLSQQKWTVLFFGILVSEFEIWGFLLSFW